MKSRKTKIARKKARRRRLTAFLFLCGIGTCIAVLFGWPRLHPTPQAVLPLRTEALGPKVAELIQKHVDAVNADPFDPERHGRLGLAYEANSLPPEAMASFDLAARLAPQDPVWPYHAAIACRMNGQFEEALDRLRELTTTFRDFAPAQHRLGGLLMEAGQFDAAEEAFGRATFLAPTAPEGYVGRARVALARQDYTHAVEQLRIALGRDPTYKMAHFLLGSAYRGLGRVEDVKRELALGLNAKPRYIPDRTSRDKGALIAGLATQLKVATNLINSGRATEAVTLLESTLRDRPNDFNVMNNLAVAYQKSNQHQRALSLLLRAQKVNENAFPTYINLAECLMEMKRPAEALEFAERAVVLAPKVGQAHFARGRALLFLRRSEEACESLRTTLSLDTRNPEAYVALSEAYMLLERFGDARAPLEEATKRLPTYLPSLVNLGVVCLKLGDPEAAERALSAARQLAPDHPRVISLAEGLAKFRDQGSSRGED